MSTPLVPKLRFAEYPVGDLSEAIVVRLGHGMVRLGKDVPTNDVELLGNVFSLGCKDGLDVNQGTARREFLVAKIDTLCAGTYSIHIHTHIHKTESLGLRMHTCMHTYIITLFS